MAHQASSIPWNVLASNLLWSEAKHPGHGDLHLRFKPDQGKQLNYFVEGFVRNIREHASTSRQKYPTHHDPPHPDAVILDDATVSKIAPTVRRWRAQLQRWHNDIIFNRERGESQVPIPVPVPEEERRASAFYRSYHENPCYGFFRVNGEAFFNLELVKTLLLYGEMDVLFSVCAHPGVDLRTWWSKGRCPCSPPDAGWDMLCTMALLPYICLNVIHCFPETWDPASGRTDAKDYRRMRIYQYMLKQCTLSGMTSDVPTHPHRQFFGIADGQFQFSYQDHTQTLPHPYGLMPLEKFLHCDLWPPEHNTTPSDIPQVRHILHSKGLPMELVLDIMQRAGYAPRGRLRVPHDPFHPDNREELAKYLRFCWEVLVRCEMLAAALGMAIPWHDVVARVVVRLFGCVLRHGPRRWYVCEYEAGEGVYRFV